MINLNMYGMKVVESEHCMQNYQLTDLTKEMMGEQWVQQFDRWAEYSLPKKPACYRIGDTLVMHPTIAGLIRRQ